MPSGKELMNLAESDNNFLSNLFGLGVGVGAGTYYYNRNKSSSTVNKFTPVIDPRSSLISKIQRLNIENLQSSALKRFDQEVASRKLDEFKKVLFSNNPIQNPNDLILAEWKAAVEATFPIPEEAYSFKSITD